VFGGFTQYFKANPLMTPQIWLAILSSSVITGLIGALLAGWFSLRSKQNEYANTYYKLVLERRLAAYEQVERLIVQIKVAIVDNDDKRPYHLLFSKDDDRDTLYKLLFTVMSTALWLSDDLFDRTRELNVLVYSRTSHGEGLIDFGRQHYTTIAELRTKMEIAHARDMLTLHEVPQFLRSKKPTDTYVALPGGG
jgi:hypothetical protein